MIWNPFKIFSQRSLGIDIGTFSIKIVELSRQGERIKLENYGEMRSRVLYKQPFRTFEKSSLSLSSKDISRAIKAILEETKISAKTATLSIPDFSSFFTSFELPPMSQEEIPQAVEFEARQHIPLHLSEVSLDWQIIDQKKPSLEETSRIKILLVAVPKEVIYQYQAIVTPFSFKNFALEAEAFALLRSLVKEEEKVVCLIDIGAQSTTASIIDKGVLKESYSFDVFSGNQLTQVLSKALDVDFGRAEKLKKKYGLLVNANKKISQILVPSVNLILIEAEKICRQFRRTGKKEVNKFILAGGSARLPGLKEYFSDHFKKEVVIGNPFSDIFYAPILEKHLKEIGPGFAIAVGAGLRNFQ
ncbi:hypothetical protein AMJ49_05235 [Parcubacteria bacterium DG_74_2]|nr:MAG: hypothetical protein AMJ49_05235 [Parcubacteria bacterium DG_74_2]